MSTINDILCQAQFSLEVNEKKITEDTRKNIIAWMNSENFNQRYLDVTNELLAKVYSDTLNNQNELDSYIQWFNTEYTALKLNSTVTCDVYDALMKLLFKRHQTEDEYFMNIYSVFFVVENCPNILIKNSCYILILRQLVNNKLTLKDVNFTQKVNNYISSLTEKEKMEVYIPNTIRALGI